MAAADVISPAASSASPPLWGDARGAPATSVDRFTPDDLFLAPEGRVDRLGVASTFLDRAVWTVSTGAALCLDRFPELPGVACCFARLPAGVPRTVGMMVNATLNLEACDGGGWLLRPREGSGASYWIPRLPMLRRLDAQGHVLSERPAAIRGLQFTPEATAIDVEIPDDSQLDWVVWRFPSAACSLVADLVHLASLEKQPVFLWGSKTMPRSPADVYLYLIHGQVYANDFVFPRRWKFFSEHDAQALYVALDGLELATGKALYRFLKWQVLYAVVARQREDGRWEDGEWTDLMESHYRSHNGAMLMMASALGETGDPVVRSALAKAVQYTVSRADKTDLGQWFLHDSLEESAAAMDEMLRQTGTRWIPSRALGKSPCNKLILNTHVDAIVAIDRYREVTGDDHHAAQLASARAATLGLLRLRPAEPLYRAIYWAVGLTLLPEKCAQRLSLPLRLIKRLTWMYLTPELYRIKQRFPRMVMPGGLIERHLSSLHFGTHYHAVNLMDLARYRRRFPGDDMGQTIEQAVEAGRRLLDHWSESKNRRFAIVVWTDALYHLYTQGRAPEHLRLLADAMARIAKLGLGHPPSLLGGDPEVVRPEDRIQCPSPAGRRLKIANLSCDGRTEFIVFNPSPADLPLAWDLPPTAPGLAWRRGDAPGVPLAADALVVPSRGWVWGSDAHE